MNRRKLKGNLVYMGREKRGKDGKGDKRETNTATQQMVYKQMKGTERGGNVAKVR